MAEGSRMWSISLLTIMLLTLLSAAPIDITDDIKKEDVKADDDAMHSHDENVTRGGKFFGHNQFLIGNHMSVDVEGDDALIGHNIDIDVHVHSHDHHHHEDTGIIVDDGWSAWSSWSDCTGTCEEATKTRTRACSGPAGDKSCPGAPTQTQSCDLPSCKDTLYMGQSLKGGEFLRSDKGTYVFVVEKDGNMVIYENLNSGRKAIWESDTKQSGSGSVFLFQEDGNLVLSNNGKPVWSSRTSSKQLLTDKTTADALVLTKDGNLELQTRSKDVLWASNREMMVSPCLFDDDLLVSRSTDVDGYHSPVEANDVFKWYQNKVPYYYSNENTKNEDKEIIRDAMDIIEKKTCFKFVFDETEKIRCLEIFIHDVIPCEVNGGLVTIVDETRLKLTLSAHVTKTDGTNCGKTGLIIHELMHALGVGHTQRRNDRDDYIEVIYKNFDSGFKSQYDKCEDCTLHDEIPYDCGSIMHYGTRDNCIYVNEEAKVIVPKDEMTCILEDKAWWSSNVLDGSKIPEKDWELLNIIGKCEVCEADKKIVGGVCMCDGTSCDVGATCTSGTTCTPAATGEWTDAVWLNDDSTQIVKNVGENTFNALFATCPVVQYSRNGAVHSVYVRTSPIPASFNAFSVFTDDWISTNNVLNTDFRLYDDLEDAKNNRGGWTFCNYVGTGYPRDCGKDGKVDYRWFEMPHKRKSAEITSGIGFDIYIGSTCPASLETGNIVKRSVQEVATVRGRIVLPADSDFTFPEDSHVHISCDDNSQLPSASLGSVEVDVSNKSSQEEIHYELVADLSNSGDISMSATINVGWNRDLNGAEWIRKGDFLNDIHHPLYATEDTSNYQIDITVAFYNY